MTKINLYEIKMLQQCYHWFVWRLNWSYDLMTFITSIKFDLDIFVLLQTWSQYYHVCACLSINKSFLDSKFLSPKLQFAYYSFLQSLLWHFNWSTLQCTIKMDCEAETFEIQFNSWNYNSIILYVHMLSELSFKLNALTMLIIRVNLRFFFLTFVVYFFTL